MDIQEYKALRDSAIRDLCKQGKSVNEIKKKYGIEKDVIVKICDGIFITENVPEDTTLL